MLIKNVYIYTEEKQFQKGEILIRGDRIRDVFFETDGRTAAPEAQCIDGKGAYVIPGLIDIHFHGCNGADFCDGTIEAIETLAAYEASVGVTAMAPATMTLPVEELEQILQVAAAYKKQVHEGADLIGINMEGPFISPLKKGAQDPRNILSCDTQIAERFLTASEGLVKWIGLAPEESEDAVAYVKAMKKKVHISLAHTNADYEQANAVFQAGADHAVHLFNAMSPYSHRDPGVVGAVADNKNVQVEMICDGVHIHPAVVRATLQMMGEERMIFVSDSIRATGMPDGRYTLGGLDVDVRGNRATLVSDGALAGSATNLMECMKIAVKEMKIPLETAVACVTINPAKAIGVYETYGSITSGKKANLVLLDRELHLEMVIKDGKIQTLI